MCQSLESVGIYKISLRLRQKLLLDQNPVLSKEGRKVRNIENSQYSLFFLYFPHPPLPLQTCQSGTSCAEGCVWALIPPPYLSSFISLISFHVFCKNNQQINPFQYLCTVTFYLGERYLFFVI